MPLKRLTILRWTGTGSVRRLSSSVECILRAHRVRGRVSSLGDSIVVRGPDPLEVAALLQHLPGVAWIAAGFAAESPDELARATASLARLYLRGGDRFSVGAEGTGGVLESDAGGAATSRILESVKRSRVSETPKVRFRVAADGRKSVIGVQIKPGPGGIPTGTEAVSCLVSGGVHSSVAAWMAALAGLELHLVHAKESEGSLLSVAKLYSELSNRMDARGLSLEVLEGRTVPGILIGYSARSTRRVVGGFHAPRDMPPVLEGSVSSPLYLVPEEIFIAEFEKLGLKPFDSEVRWGMDKPTKFRRRLFSGGPADVSDVLDQLR